jgi:DNA replication licensing factor MCM5
MNIHMNRQNQRDEDGEQAEGEISLEKMKKYIAYCKR